MYDKGDRAHMENNVIEAIEFVMHDAKALEQDFAKMLDELGSTLFKNKLENLEKRAQAFAVDAPRSPKANGMRRCRQCN